jgi:hypothetical protein
LAGKEAFAFVSAANKFLSLFGFSPSGLTFNENSRLFSNDLAAESIRLILFSGWA